MKNKSSAVAEMGDRFATIDMGRRADVPLSVKEAGSPPNTMSPGLRPTSVLSGILIHPAVWPVATMTWAGNGWDYCAPFRGDLVPI